MRGKVLTKLFTNFLAVAPFESLKPGEHKGARHTRKEEALPGAP